MVSVVRGRGRACACQVAGNPSGGLFFLGSNAAQIKERKPLTYSGARPISIPSGPDLWCAFEDGEVEVIGEEPANTIKRQASFEIAVSCSEGAEYTAQTTEQKFNRNLILSH